MNETYYTAAEAWQLLKFPSKDAFYAAVRAGHVPHIRLGKRIRVPASALENLLKSQTPEKNIVLASEAQAVSIAT